MRWSFSRVGTSSCCRARGHSLRNLTASVMSTGTESSAGIMKSIMLSDMSSSVSSSLPAPMSTSMASLGGPSRALLLLFSCMILCTTLAILFLACTHGRTQREREVSRRNNDGGVVTLMPFVSLPYWQVHGTMGETVAACGCACMDGWVESE